MTYLGENGIKGNAMAGPAELFDCRALPRCHHKFLLLQRSWSTNKLESQDDGRKNTRSSISVGYLDEELLIFLELLQ
jgi:hypothetical protein